MLITVNVQRRQTHTHACPARGQPVTQTQVHGVSQRDSQSSPDQSPQAISASQSLLTQLPRCAGVVGSAEEELLAIDLDGTTKAAIRRLPASGLRAQVEAQLCRQPGVPNLTRGALPHRREHRSPAQPDPATRRLTMAWRQPLAAYAHLAIARVRVAPAASHPLSQAHLSTIAHSAGQAAVARALHCSLAPLTRLCRPPHPPGDLHHRRCSRLGGPL